MDGKIETLKLFLESEKQDIMALNEIKLDKPAANNISYIKGYSMVFKCVNSFGGGVALLIRDNIPYEEIKIPNEFTDEIIGIFVKLKGRKVAIFTHYNPPSESLNKSLYEYIDNKYKEYLIIGDLNAKIRPYNKTSNKNGKILNDIMIKTRAQIINPINAGFTSFRSTMVKSSHSTLDYMVGTELFYESLENFKTHKYSILSHHQNLYYHVPIIGTFNLEKHQKILEKSKNNTFIYERADWVGFIKSCDLKLENIKASEDIVEMSNKLSQLIKEAAEDNIPTVEKKSDRISNLPDFLVTLIKTKNYWWRKFKKTQNKKAKENLDALREIIQIEMLKFKDNQWKNSLERLGKSPLALPPFGKELEG